MAPGGDEGGERSTRTRLTVTSRAQLFLFVALKQAKNLHKRGRGTRFCSGRKQQTHGIFVICTIMHFAAFAWMDPVLVGILTPVCFVVGVVFPIIMCKHGDGQLKRRRPSPRTSPGAGGARRSRPCRSRAKARHRDVTRAVRPVLAPRTSSRGTSSWGRSSTEPRRQ